MPNRSKGNFDGDTGTHFLGFEIVRCSRSACTIFHMAGTITAKFWICLVFQHIRGSSSDCHISFLFIRESDEPANDIRLTWLR